MRDARAHHARAQYANLLDLRCRPRRLTRRFDFAVWGHTAYIKREFRVLLAQEEDANEILALWRDAYFAKDFRLTLQPVLERTR